ncbi:MAG: hypothetical protein NTW19_06595 [Planctomycetota bacterium]|nr:hypothetical protein [Planctomycetota bacterium]
MPISIQCSGCGARYSVKDDLAGKKVRCKKCNEAIRVGAGTGSTDGPPPPPPRRDPAPQADAASDDIFQSVLSDAARGSSSEPMPLQTAPSMPPRGARKPARTGVKGSGAWGSAVSIAKLDAAWGVFFLLLATDVIATAIICVDALRASQAPYNPYGGAALVLLVSACIGGLWLIVNTFRQSVMLGLAVFFLPGTITIAVVAVLGREKFTALATNSPGSIEVWLLSILSNCFTIYVALNFVRELGKPAMLYIAMLVLGAIPPLLRMANPPATPTASEVAAAPEGGAPAQTPGSDPASGNTRVLAPFPMHAPSPSAGKPASHVRQEFFPSAAAEAARDKHVVYEKPDAELSKSCTILVVSGKAAKVTYPSLETPVYSPPTEEEVLEALAWDRNKSAGQEAAAAQRQPTNSGPPPTSAPLPTRRARANEPAPTGRPFIQGMMQTQSAPGPNGERTYTTISGSDAQQFVVAADGTRSAPRQLTDDEFRAFLAERQKEAQARKEELAQSQADEAAKQRKEMDDPAMVELRREAAARAESTERERRELDAAMKDRMDSSWIASALADLKSPDPRRVSDAVEFTMDKQPLPQTNPAFYAGLAAMLDSPEPRERITAMDLSARLRYEPAAAKIASMLSPNQPEAVVKTALDALSRFPNEFAMNARSQYLTQQASLPPDKQPRPKPTVLTAADKAAYDRSLNDAAGPDPARRRLALRFLQNFPADPSNPKAFDMLSQSLRTSDDATCEDAVAAFAKVQDPRVVRALMAFANSSDSSAAVNSVCTALMRMRTPDALGASSEVSFRYNELMRLDRMQRGDQESKAAECVELGRTGRARCIPALEKLRDAPEARDQPVFRKAADEAIKAIRLREQASPGANGNRN